MIMMMAIKMMMVMISMPVVSSYHHHSNFAMITTPITNSKTKALLSSYSTNAHLPNIHIPNKKRTTQLLMSSTNNDMTTPSTSTSSTSSPPSESYYINQINTLSKNPNSATTAQNLLDEMERYYCPPGSLYSTLSTMYCTEISTTLTELTSLQSQISTFGSFESSDLSLEQKRQEEARLRNLQYQKQELYDQIQNSAKKALDIVQRAELLFDENSELESLVSKDTYLQVIQVWEDVLEKLKEEEESSEESKVMVKGFFKEKEGRDVVNELKRKCAEMDLLLAEEEEQKKNEQDDSSKKHLEHDSSSSVTKNNPTTTPSPKETQQRIKQIKSKQDILSLVQSLRTSKKLSFKTKGILKARFQKKEAALTTWNLNFLLSTLATMGTVDSASIATDLLEFMILSYAEDQEHHHHHPPLHDNNQNNNNNNSNDILKPNSASINTVLDAWANVAKYIGDESPTQINALLKQWKLWSALYEGVFDEVLIPDIISYNTLIKSWGRSVLSRSYDVVSNRNNEGSMTTTADILRPGREGERILLQMTQQQQQQQQQSNSGMTDGSGGMVVKPDIVTYACVLDTWANCALRASMNGDVIAAKESSRRAEELLGSMRRSNRINRRTNKNDDLEYVDGMNMDDDCILDFQPTTIIQQQSQQSRKKSAASGSSDNFLKPNTRCFNAVLKAHANSGVEGSGMRALRLLRAMEESCELNRDEEGNYEEDDDEDGDGGQSPDTRTYNIVLNALANSKDFGATQTACDLLREMEEEFEEEEEEEEEEDDEEGAVEGGEVEDGEEEKMEGDDIAITSTEEEKEDTTITRRKRKIRPDTYTYNTVIDVLAKSGERDAAEKATELLKRMEYLYKVQGRDEVKPDKFTYTSVINAWSKSREKGAARRAEQLVFDLIKGDDGDYADNDRIVKLDSSIYNALINCWAKSGEYGAEERAEEILHTMEKRHEMYQDEDIRPNVRTYTSVIDALANANSNNYIPTTMTATGEGTSSHPKMEKLSPAKRALDILNRMESLYEQTRNRSIRPNIRTYTAVITCWARSSERGKALVARDILKRMEEQYFTHGNNGARPNIYAYNAVLNACGYTPTMSPDDSDDDDDYGDTVGNQDEVEQAFRVACQTFDDVRRAKGLYPSHVTYGLFLGVCSHLMPKSDVRNDLVEKVFRRCCIDGQVGDLVLRRLKQAASPDLYERLLQGETEDDLPSKWTRSVRRRG